MIHESAAVIDNDRGLLSPTEIFAVFSDGRREPITVWAQKPGELIVEALARTALEMGAERVTFRIG